MDMKKAAYLTSGVANWQQGIGMLIQTNNKVIPYTIPIVNGTVRLP